MSEVVLVALGSAVGGVFRYLTGLCLKSNGVFPVATFAVNIAGSLLIGIISGWLSRLAGQGEVSSLLRTFLVIGVCGGFTTFSTFSNELFRMLYASQYLIAALYATLSLLSGILSVFFGWMLSRIG